MVDRNSDVKSMTSAAEQLSQASTQGDSRAAQVAWGRFTQAEQIAVWNQRFEDLSATERVAWALKTLPGAPVLTSSFGAQAAVSLHMLTQVKADIPVILIDTGYLFPETYNFVDELTERLNLNLHIFRAHRSPAWQEAAEGQRWLQGVDGVEAYNQENKVEPMQRALAELNVGTWFTGVRRNQAQSRARTPFIANDHGYFKVAPLADWSDKDVFSYLQAHDLPYHPLWEKGYVSIGDVHTTRALHEVDSEEETRFFGLKRECGLHEVL
ncbi:MAG: phosphoadenylyl-sulfate reductase [bacterium]